MNYLTAFTAAVKGKAPIVALPVEGHAPACINRKRIAAWSKGVTVTKIEVVQHPPVTHYDYKRPQSSPYDEHGRFIGGVAEGPIERIAIVVPGERILTIEGTAGRVKTRCSPALIDRRVAVKELSAWSEKERLKLEKQRLLGALSPAARKTLKRAKYETAGDDIVTIRATHHGTRKTVHGVAVTMPALADLEFVVHVRIDGLDGWAVTERYTGLAAGFGTTAEDAIVAARRNVATATPARLVAIRKQSAEAALAA